MHILFFKYSKEQGDNLQGIFKCVLKGIFYFTVESPSKVLLEWR